jgi:hypothetical protein
MSPYEAAMCAGKQRFDHRDVACKVARRMSRNRHRKSQVYTCEYCRKFHVGVLDFNRSQRRPKVRGT